MISLNIPKNRLIEYYAKERLSSLKIADIFNCSDATIRNYLRKYKILVRDRGEYSIGINNPNYKDGRHLKSYYCIA